jgi:hypothetical protein
MIRPASRAVSLLALGCLAVSGCGIATPTSPGPEAVASASPAAAPGEGTALGVATDQPCTRLPASVLQLPRVPLHHEDLERMVPERGEITGLETFAEDYLTWGYLDNAEITWTVPAPPTTCEDSARFGRLEGYITAWAPRNDPARNVLFAAHLFDTEEGATAWATSFHEGLAAAAGAPGADFTYRLLEPWGSGLGIELTEHSGGDGTRTWAVLQSGPVIGWVIDRHPVGGEGSIDVLDAAGRMAARIDAVRTEAAGRERLGLDVAQLLAAPLPLAEYGETGTGMAWDGFFGGCQDTVERGLIAGDDAAAAARRLGRVTGCVAMYAPEDPGGDVVRVFSSATVYRNADGARASIDEMVTEYEGRGGRQFPVDGVGDRAAGLVTPIAEGEGTPYTDTRAAFSIGELAGSVVIGRAEAAPEDEVRALAARLEERLGALLGAE